jgi:hypothetical protein
VPESTVGSSTISAASIGSRRRGIDWARASATSLGSALEREPLERLEHALDEPERRERERRAPKGRDVDRVGREGQVPLREGLPEREALLAEGRLREGELRHARAIARAQLRAAEHAVRVRHERRQRGLHRARDAEGLRSELARVVEPPVVERHLREPHERARLPERVADLAAQPLLPREVAPRRG